MIVSGWQWVWLCLWCDLHNVLHHVLTVIGKLKLSCTLIEAGFSSSVPLRRFLLMDLVILFASTNQ